MTWMENEKRKDLVVTKVVDELCTGSDKIPRSLKDQAFAVLDLAADSNEKWRNLRKWDPDCIPEERHIPKPSSHLNPVVWDVVDKMTNALFRGPCRVLLVFGEPAHIRRWKRLVRLIKIGLLKMEKTYEELMAEAAAAQGQKAKRRGGGRRGAGQETEGADEPSQPQKGGGQGRDGGGLPVAEKGAVCTAVDPIRDVEPDVRMRFMDGAKLGRGGWTSKWVEDMWLNWQHKYPKKEDFLLFGTLLGREKEKVVIRWFDEGYELGRSDESERRFRFPLKFASEHVTLLKEGASWDNIPSHRPGKR
eukprot:jgi/Mesvir1/1683/Mv21147-RA.1